MAQAPRRPRLSSNPGGRPAYVSADTVDLVVHLVEALTTKRCFVGIPCNGKPRPPEPGQNGPPANNAMIGFVMEAGSPAHNIPRRAFLLPGVGDAQDKIVKRLRLGGIAGLAASNAAEAEQAAIAALQKAGMDAQTAVVAKITDGPFVPLAPATVAARARRGRKGALQELRIRKQLAANDNPLERAMQGLPQTEDLVRPLNDLGELRRSVTYVLMDS